MLRGLFSDWLRSLAQLWRTYCDWAQASLTNSRRARAYYAHRKAQHHRRSTILRGLGLSVNSSGEATVNQASTTRIVRLSSAWQ